jgi:uncharacterized protein
MNNLEQFQKKKYLNLETFRKSGEGVRTPVWFAQDGGRLYVITMADSWKVKRIHREERVNVAPCRADGKVNGKWIPARACEITDPTVWEKVNRLFDKKYGLIKKLFERQRSKAGSQDTVLEIELERNEP